MLNLNRSKNNKWIFQKNINSSNLVEAFIQAQEMQWNIINREQTIEILRARNAYRWRGSDWAQNTMWVRLSQLCFYMFCYKKGDHFFQTPTTELFIRNDWFWKEKALLINLFSLQYPNPYSETPENFNIYAWRLVVKLLLEERIWKKLYPDEFIRFIMFLERIDENIYEELINEILRYRALSYIEKKNLFMSITNHNEVFANCIHEANYYFFRIFNWFWVFELIEDNWHNGWSLFKFQHWNTSTYRSDAIISRWTTSWYIKLFDSLVDKAQILNDQFSAFDTPDTQATCATKDERIRELYEFNMLKYISIINEDNEYDENVINILKNMVYQSRFWSNDGRTFEDSLVPVFELFRENIDSTIISWAWDTDILCTMEVPINNRFKINADAKKKQRWRLEAINPVRLTNHLRRNGSRYCIVVAPKFASGTQWDISWYNIVTLEAETLAKYCLKECLNSHDWLADYESIHSLIEHHLWTDITSNIDSLIDEKYWINN